RYRPGLWRAMSLLGRIRRRASDDRGAVLVMMAFALPAIIGFAIRVVDGGNWFAHKRHLQLQADAGALAGGSYFQDCIGNTASASTQIANTARLYAGDPGVIGSYNGQIGNANKGAITVLLNSKTFAAKSPPPDDTVAVPQNQPTLCDAKQLDGKITEADLPFFLKKLAVVPAINAQARVEIQKVGSEYDVRPIAIRDDSYYQCAQAQLFNTDAN